MRRPTSHPRLSKRFVHHFSGRFSLASAQREMSPEGNETADRPFTTKQKICTSFLWAVLMGQLASRPRRYNTTILYIHTIAAKVRSQGNRIASSDSQRMMNRMFASQPTETRTDWLRCPELDPLPWEGIGSATIPKRFLSNSLIFDCPMRYPNQFHRQAHYHEGPRTGPGCDEVPDVPKALGKTKLLAQGLQVVLATTG